MAESEVKQKEDKTIEDFCDATVCTDEGADKERWDGYTKHNPVQLEEYLLSPEEEAIYHQGGHLPRLALNRDYHMLGDKRFPPSIVGPIRNGTPAYLVALDSLYGLNPKDMRDMFYSTRGKCDVHPRVYDALDDMLDEFKHEIRGEHTSVESFAQALHEDGMDMQGIKLMTAAYLGLDILSDPQLRDDYWRLRFTVPKSALVVGGNVVGNWLPVVKHVNVESTYDSARSFTGWGAVGMLAGGIALHYLGDYFVPGGGEAVSQGTMQSASFAIPAVGAGLNALAATACNVGSVLGFLRAAYLGVAWKAGKAKKLVWGNADTNPKVTLARTNIKESLTAWPDSVKKLVTVRNALVEYARRKEVAALPASVAFEQLLLEDNSQGQLDLRPLLPAAAVDDVEDSKEE